MRIIDKNTDFYDYVQHMYNDGTFTFDRTDSYILDKAEMCKRLDIRKAAQVGNGYFLLLQICNTFWLFYAEITRISKNTSTSRDEVRDYSIDLIASWKNYNLPSCLISLKIVEFGPALHLSLWYVPWKSRKTTSIKDIVLSKSNDLIEAINHNDYNVRRDITEGTVTSGDGVTQPRSIPILKASGLAPQMSGLDVFLAFEEYFSLQKTASERTESIDLTDKEKIENHGFDVKKSFRGN